MTHDEVQMWRWCGASSRVEKGPCVLEMRYAMVAMLVR